MAQEVQDIRPGADDVRPLDTSLERALRDYTVAFHLVPLPKFAMREDTAQPTRKHGSEPYAKMLLNPVPPKGKERASTKVEKHLARMQAPKGYHGCVGRDAKNRPIRFDYNIAGCSKAPAGGSCAKGRHVCLRGGCFKMHPFKEAHAAEVPKPNE